MILEVYSTLFPNHYPIELALEGFSLMSVIWHIMNTSEKQESLASDKFQGFIPDEN